MLNLQGDVIAIIDSNGAVAVKYEYDAWGKEINYTTAGEFGSTLYAHNCLKYRGYYYDSDLEMYYLNSRFYDPAISRFINADSGISGNGEELLGYNMYTYCFNNPINLDDSEGNWPKWAQKIGSAVKKAVTKTVSKVTNIVKKVVNETKQRYKKSTKNLVYTVDTARGQTKITNSHEVRNPLTMYVYVNKNRGKDLDFGSTIYDDNHGLESRLMQISYYVLSPQNAIYDLIVEIFE